MSIELINTNLAAWDAFWRCREPGMRRVTVQYPLATELPVTLPDIDDEAVIRGLQQPLDALGEGFHNLPMLQAQVPSSAGTHLLSWLLGMDIVTTGEGHQNFSAWTRPLASIDAVYQLRLPDLAEHPYGRALRAAVAAVPPAWQTCFPVLCGGGSPLDAAADILGTTEFFQAFHTDPEALRHLLDLCTDLVTALYRLQRETCANGRGHYGVPGVYVNDLVTEYLSAEHWREFVLPCYRKLARAVGGLALGANAPDPRVLPLLAEIDGFLGCTVHRDVPLETVIGALRGRGVYILNSHAYDPRFAGPTLHRGTYYNPIVAYPYANYREIFHRLAGEVALLVNLERPDRTAALADARALL